MLANTITLADNALTDHDYDLVARAGMTSDRRETVVASKVESVMQIKNTIVFNSDTPNRHLIKFSWNEVDATTGDLYPCSVHAVITRHKLADDDNIRHRLTQLANFLLDGSSISDVLRGGN